MTDARCAATKTHPPGSRSEAEPVDTEDADALYEKLDAAQSMLAQLSFADVGAVRALVGAVQEIAAAITTVQALQS